jgi:hypothetical protein
MILRTVSFSRASLALLAGALGLSACAEPCLDDGLSQDENDGDCPAVSASVTDSETDSNTITDSDGPDDCNNGTQDGDETDIDCGGSCGTACDDGEGCENDDDCESGRCDAGTCQPPATCDDGVQNGDETDVDCGGTCPAGCDDGEDCIEDDDCMSMTCDPDTMTCGPSGSCDDDMQNGDETDVDCGGSCPDDCDVGEGCVEDDDCATMVCDPKSQTCAEEPSCTNNMVDGEESDVDCGGSECPPCDDGSGCDSDGDCASGVCDEEAGVCLPASCMDQTQNADETDIDCGGSCPDDCDDGEGCENDDDCISGACDEGKNICSSRACDDNVHNGDETDVDCGGSCPNDCDDGLGCIDGDDCISQVCDPLTLTCTPPACDDGVQNGDETDLDCGGACGATCETGEDCQSGLDCIDDVCEPVDFTCAPPLTVVAAPACSDFAGAPVLLDATAAGGTGVYTYSWTPIAGLDDATAEDPNASPDGFVTYTVTVDDGVNQAQDSVTVVDNAPFDLQNNCTLYQGDFLSGTPAATITYSQGGTVACENGNNDFGLHLCETVSFQDVQLRGVIEVTEDTGDDDVFGLVWGAQDNANFYSLSWKRTAQNFFNCQLPAGIVVKRVQAADFASLTGDDVYCPNDTPGSTLLLDPTMTTTEGWAEGESYTVTIDYSTAGSDVSVVRDSDAVVMATFAIGDATYPAGAFGSTTISQANACVGPLDASCL